MKKNILALLCLCLLAVFTISGCDSSTQPAENPDKNPPAEGVIQQEALLYFGNSTAEGLVGEKRTLEVKSQDELPVALVEALISGPKNPDLSPTLPPETRLLGVTIQDKTAAVDFSQEIVSQHWGGSTGETMTILSVVNTLTELDTIDQVQFMVEGKTVDSLLGHWTTEDPIQRDDSFILEAAPDKGASFGNA